MSPPHRLPSGGARLAVDRAGAGDPVVFLHAGVADRRMWQPQFDRMRERFTVVAYDRRGFGLTTSPDEPFSHVEDAVAVLDHCGPGPAVLVGCSQGGRIALEVALAHPDRVAALVLVAPAVTGAAEPASWSPEIQQLIDDIDAAEAAQDLDRVNELEARIWLDGVLAPAGRITGALRALFLDMNRIALHAPPLTRQRDPDVAPGEAIDRLAGVHAPTAIVWGDLDFPHIQTRCQALARTIPGATATVIPDTAHLPSLEQPALFDRHLAAFLAR